MNLPFEISIQVIGFIVAFVIALIVGPILIPALTRLKAGSTIRDDGPKTHLKKMGTPLMGGFIFLIPIVILSLFFAKDYPQIIALMLATVGFGVIGFIDDYIKVVLKRKDGLYAGKKMLGLLIVSAAFTFYVVQFTDLGTDIVIPFLGVDRTFDIAWVYIPLTIVTFLAITNSVNLTDGLDGLCAGVTLIVMVFFTIVAMTRSEWDYIKIFSAITAGGCLGFLAFNAHPAKIFMGDTGSLALGGAVGAIAVMMKMHLLLFIVGIIYVAEALSDIIQVMSFKLTGKRVFKMAPIHHHFELMGWKETKVVAVFWTVTAIFCVIGLLSLRFKLF